MNYIILLILIYIYKRKLSIIKIDIVLFYYHDIAYLNIALAILVKYTGYVLGKHASPMRVIYLLR